MTRPVVAPPPTRQRHRPRRSRAVRLLRWIGWLLVAAGTLVLLYLVYSLFFTNVATRQAQSSLADQWEAQVGSVEEQPQRPAPRPTAAALPPEPEPRARRDQVDPPTLGDAPAAPAPDIDIGALAVLQFSRPSASQPPVHADPLYVVDGVSIPHLQQGPGHYPETALPGEDGNFAVAGHRTTYGAPFFHLDQLQPGDEILVTDRSGERWVYRFAERRIVHPGDTWVLEPDPLDSGRPTLTLTTCHPRYSAAERMVVFAELVP